MGGVQIRSLPTDPNVAVTGERVSDVMETAGWEGDVPKAPSGPARCTLRNPRGVKVLDGKVCMVTGAGSGIGAATSQVLHEAGATVVLTDVDEDALQAQADRLDPGPQAVAMVLDVRDRQAVQAVVEAIVDRFGRLDGAFNNAGIMRAWTRLGELGADDWQAIRETNLDGMLHCLTAQLGVMAHQGSGAIVNCSSVAGFSGFPQAGAYAATKHAVLGLTRTAALEYASQGIRVNAVCPGPVDTPLLARVLDDEAAIQAIAEDQPAGRLVEPAEVGHAVAFLLSQAASGINGASLVVDGGLSAG